MSAFIPHRLTVRQFALCVQRCETVVRRWIRANVRGVRKHVAGRPYLIDPKALELFGVSGEMARARLGMVQGATAGDCATDDPAARLIALLVREIAPDRVRALLAKLEPPATAQR